LDASPKAEKTGPVPCINADCWKARQRDPELNRAGVSKAQIARVSISAAHSSAGYYRRSSFEETAKDPIREERIDEEAIVDAY